MKILYVALKYDYNDPARGLSFEHYNFFDCLRRMGHEIVYFDFGSLLKWRDRTAVNQRLADTVREEKPDLLFSMLFSDEIDAGTIRRITDSGIPTINWFCDDHWRFESFSSRFAPAFRWVVTTATSALPKYERLGIRNVIKSQWACNPFLYRKLPMAATRAVTFVGQPHGDRRAWIERLERAGIRVDTWGEGWPNGRLGQQAMIELFNQSRINLNLSNSAAVQPTRWQRLSKRMGWRPSPKLAPHQQIKGRDFEAPACGGFLLTGQSDELPRYYDIGREIVCYRSVGDLIDKIRYFESHERERAAISEAGYQRTHREHTYVHRFTELFQRMGLMTAPAHDILNRPPAEGLVREAA